MCISNAPQSQHPGSGAKRSRMASRSESVTLHHSTDAAEKNGQL